MINKANAQLVLDRLAELPEDEFDIYNWGGGYLNGKYRTNYEIFTTDCGTTACVAGHTVAVMLDNLTPKQWRRQFAFADIRAAAEEWLELDDDESEFLFFTSEPSGIADAVARITELMAAV